MKSPLTRRQNSGHIVGIDEVGRGPLAGPVAIGVASIPKEKMTNARKIFRTIRDSKQHTANEREEWFVIIEREVQRGNLEFTVSFSKNTIIDRDGMTRTIKRLIKRSLERLNTNPKKSRIFLDGGLKAPRIFTKQKTIIKGDEKIMVISIASVAAKVLRDRYMTKIANQFPEYHFEVHKGYGTQKHIEKIKIHGPSSLHRMSFLKNFINTGNS